ncbi:MAG: lipoprotein-releasing ABC transporter ATP-binding protein LolD [Pseudomonadales bacterium]
MSVVLSCAGVCKSYQQGPLSVDVLRGVNLRVEKAERIAIVGSSGAGKSTLLNMLGGLDTPSAGEVEVAGEKMSLLDGNARAQLRNRSLGFVYQFHHLLGEFTALENVSMPLLIRGDAVDGVKARAGELLSRVGLQDRFHHKPAELSGGERQRVAIARALVASPDCVLLDEPTGNLDQETAQRVLALMLELNRELDISFITVTHDMTLARSMDRILELRGGLLLPTGEV